jgi:putative endonuclease
LKQKASPSTIRGAAAEHAAATFLQQQGLRLLARNYRFKGGEIDLVFEQAGRRLVFVEVRMRNHHDYGSGAESVTLNKQRRLSKTALHYLQHHPDYQGHEIRFDVLSARQQGGQFQLEWIQEAFWPAEL